MSAVQFIIFSLVIIHFLVKSLLESMNIKYSLKSANAYIDEFDEETVKKTKAYSLDKHHLGQKEAVLSLILLLLILFFPILPTLYDSVYDLSTTWSKSKLWNEALFVVVISLIFAIVHLPFELWRIFKLEEKYGFNKMTFKLWLSDKIKGFFLSILIAFPLLLLLLYLVQKIGNHWWIVAAVIVIGFQLLMLVLYPKLIMPLFNKFSPLNDGELKDRLFKLAKKTSFATNKIEVIDNSKRSGHSNAFFTGFGKFRKIVLFDTLIEQLSTDEVEAVLAHEIGHYKKGHIPKKLFFSFLMTFIVFGVIAWAMNQVWLIEAFGFSKSSFAVMLILLSLYGGIISFWFSPIVNWKSRKDEYEADAYAKSIIASPIFLINALKKLVKKNLSNFEPHPMYSMTYYSHPTLKEREKALLKQ